MKNKFLTYFMWLFGILELCLICYAFYYHEGSMDHAEHLHASWMVWLGKVPYKDFFEHHNPLFWYILSPIVALFYNNAIILYVSRIISFLIYCALFFVLYKITKRFMGYTLKSFLLSIIIYMGLPDSYYTLYELHPDEIMLLFYFIGFYNYCLYLEIPKQKYLNISFLMFVISFLILQKILVILFILGLCTLYFIYKKQIKIKSIFLASIAPLFLLLLFIAWLSYNGILKIYYLFNYDFNLYIQKFYALGKIYANYGYTIYYPIIALFLLKPYLSNKNRYKVLFVIIMVGEYIFKYITGAPFSHYFVYNNLISALIIGYCINQNIASKKPQIMLCFMLVISAYLFYKSPLNKNYPKYYKMYDYLFSHISKDDTLISTINYINIYGKDASYYWFGVGNVAPVAYYLYQYKEPFMLNKSIIEHKPKIIFNNLYTNQFILTNLVNNVSYKDYVANLYNIYEEFPIKLETKENFVRRWSLNEFAVYDVNIIIFNYVKHPELPLFIRKDLLKVR